MQNKLLSMTAIAMMVALIGGVIAKQMGLSRIVAECSRLAKTLSEEGRGKLEVQRITPLNDAVRGKGLLILFTPGEPPSTWDSGAEDWAQHQTHRLALKAILLKGIPANFLVMDCEGRKTLVTSTQITKHLPELAQPTADS